MNVIKIIFLLSIILLASCKNDKNRWKIDVEPISKPVEIIDVSSTYYNSGVSNNELRQKFPDWFGQASDSLLNARRKDSIDLILNRDVQQIFGKQTNLSDSLNSIFARLQYFYPQFQVPKVYTFTGELDYENPVAYFPESHDMVIGLDWFFGEKNKAYQTLAVPDYFTSQMNPANLKPKVVENIAKQMVPYDIRKRTFIDKMIYEGKLLVIQDALLPDTPDYLKIGYTPTELEWAKLNETQVYSYFTEEQIFFSDDKRLNARFLDQAPFSKFFSENDTQSPGRIAAWMGWQICRSYLNKNKKLTLQEFLLDEDLQKIFKESGYKPSN